MTDIGLIFYLGAPACRRYGLAQRQAGLRAALLSHYLAHQTSGLMPCFL